nr:hypothetical protein [Tanacetum cinerariifolium]
MKKSYCLVVTDDYSRFTWVFFLATKDDTSGIFKSFITGIENLVDHKVNVIRCDNKIELKNKEMNQFCEMKEAVSTACYVQNKVLVVKPHNKTLYKLFHGRTPALSFMRPFGCPVTILNTINHLSKFDGKADKGFCVGYSLNSKAYRVFNSRTRIVEENSHIRFSESTPNVVGSRPDWLFDTDALTRTMNYDPIVVGTKSNGFADLKSSHDNGSKPSSDDQKKVDEDLRKESKCNDQDKEDNVNSTNNVNVVGINEVNTVGENISIELSFDPNMPPLEDKKDGTFISQDKYVAKILKKFVFVEVKTASTPMEMQKPLLKDKDGEEVDVHMYRYQVNLKVQQMPTDPHHTPTILQPSSSQPQKTQKPKKPKRKDTQVAQSSSPTESVLNEAVHKELGNSLVRAATTASSLEAKQDSGANSGGGPRCQETMRDTIAETRVESSGDEESLGEDAPK